MRAPPLISFVVPCYNYARYLAVCLNSILTLDGNYDFEIIAIDDCSSDNTRDLLAQIGDPRLRVILHSENKGHVFTVNEGLEETRGKYVARIDPDDRYRRNFLVHTVPILERYPEVGVAYGDVAMIDENGNVNCESCDAVHGGSDFKGNEFIALLKKNFICAPSVLARREAWMSAWPIPEGLAFNDWYFHIMLARRYDFYYVDKVVAEYRVHGANHHSKIIRDRSEEASIIRLLDEVFAEKEESDALQRAKISNRDTIYAAQYLDFADKYFWFGMSNHARRCYLAAITRQPSFLIRGDIVRHLLATYVPRQWYNSAKRLIGYSPALR
jgi:glycosyltransferase involved in cell wall biosynthesis